MSKEVVFLLHGLARSEKSMLVLQRALREQGYQVENIGYRSTRDNIQNLAESVISNAIKKYSTERRLHFVTHSMGGILVRQYLNHHAVSNLGRVCMLGPPNQGTEVVDKLGDLPGFHWINGDAAMQLGTMESSIPQQLGAANFEVGIIAGTRSINWLLSTLIPGTDDGKVSVANTKLEGMSDHLEMAVTHPFMMRNRKVIEQVIHYLQTGHFMRA